VELVYAKGAQIIGDVRVVFGSHWPADDPLVAGHPDLFSRDPRWGLVYTVEPPGYRDGTDNLTRAPEELPLDRPVTPPLLPAQDRVPDGRPARKAKPDA
jgi:hypothetical protein